MTDPEFAAAQRETQAEAFGGVERPEPDLYGDGLNHSLFSRLVALLLPKGPA